MSVLIFPRICGCGMQKDAPKEVLGLSFRKFSCGLRFVMWVSIPSDRTAEGMGGQSMVGRDGNNKGTALCEFTTPFHGCTVRNSVPWFYLSRFTQNLLDFR